MSIRDEDSTKCFLAAYNEYKPLLHYKVEKEKTIIKSHVIDEDLMKLLLDKTDSNFLSDFFYRDYNLLF